MPGQSAGRLRIVNANPRPLLLIWRFRTFRSRPVMHLDLDAYLALGGLGSVLVITFGLLAFLLLRKR